MTVIIENYSDEEKTEKVSLADLILVMVNRKEHSR
jgi:hypothetical protein